MPNSQFEPIIGEGFSDIGRQRAQWAQFNRGVEDENLNRLAQSEQSRNSWLARMQQIDESDAARASQAQQEAEAARQFDVKAGLSAQESGIRYSAENDRTAAMNKQIEANTLKDKQNADTVETFAKTIAPEAHDYSSKVENSQQAFNTAARDLDTRGAELLGQMPQGRVRYDGKSKNFVASNPTDTEAANIAADSNLKMATTKANYDEAKSQLAFHQKRLTDLSRHAQTYGLMISRKGDQWVVVDPSNGKTYSAQGKTMQTQPAPGFTFTSGSSEWTKPVASGPQFGAFAASAPVTQNSSSPFSEGQVIRSKRDGQLYRVTNGVPVAAQ